MSTEDAAALHAELLARGANAGELLSWPGVPPMFAVHDQDGNAFSIIQ